QIHTTTSAAVANTATQLEGTVEYVRLDDARTQEILRRHLRLPAERWEQLGRRDMTFGAHEAVEFGFADEIREFAPPAGAKVFNI
ncbi:MAG: ATP-dependent Clp protease proteolytic subunit, partial [Bryobacteraceae bacterium]